MIWWLGVDWLTHPPLSYRYSIPCGNTQSVVVWSITWWLGIVWLIHSQHNMLSSHSTCKPSMPIRAHMHTVHSTCDSKQCVHAIPRQCALCKNFKADGAYEKHFAATEIKANFHSVIFWVKSNPHRSSANRLGSDGVSNSHTNNIKIDHDNGGTLHACQILRTSGLRGGPNTALTLQQ